MKKLLFSTGMSVLLLVGFTCFATSSSHMPDSFKVEVTPSEFTAEELVDLKITALKYGEVMKNYEGYMDIVVMDDNGSILQSKDATVPDGGWGYIRLQDSGIRKYEKAFTVKKQGEFTVLVSEFTDESIKGETRISVKGKPVNTTTEKTNNSNSLTTQTAETESIQIYNNSQSSFTFPDSFKVEISSNNFKVGDSVDLVIKAMKNGKTMDNYEGNVSIKVIDSVGNLLQSDDVVLPDGGWGTIKLQDKGVKTYSKGLKLKKAGTFTVLVSEFTDESIKGSTSINVTPVSNNLTSTNNGETKKVLTNDEIVQLLNKKGITIHKNRQDFKPNKDIRRDEAAKMLSVASKNIANGVKLKAAGSCSFIDLDNARADLRTIVIESCNLGLFKGSNHKFNPSNSITNAQLLTVVGRMLYGMQNESGEHYAKVYIDKLTKDGYLSDMNLTRSMRDSKAKRGDIAKILSKIIK